MAMRPNPTSAVRFLLVGGTTVVIDALTYAFLNAVGVDYDLAKTISFVTGAVFAYFGNWRFTFGTRRSRWSEALFVVIYVLALGINILLNGLVRSVDTDSTVVAALAFLVATGASAVWNFIGMSLFVFRRPGSPRTGSTGAPAVTEAPKPFSPSDVASAEPSARTSRAGGSTR